MSLMHHSDGYHDFAERDPAPTVASVSAELAALTQQLERFRAEWREEMTRLTRELRAR